MKGHHRGRLPRLTVVRVEDVPIKEVSGVCLRRDADGVMALVAIGDRAATAAWVVLPADDGGPLVWQVADLTGLPDAGLPAQDPQLEAVCADGAGRVLLLQETPPRAVLIDPAIAGRSSPPSISRSRAATRWRTPGTTRTAPRARAWSCWPTATC